MPEKQQSAPSMSWAGSVSEQRHAHKTPQQLATSIAAEWSRPPIKSSSTRSSAVSTNQSMGKDSFYSEDGTQSITGGPRKSSIGRVVEKAKARLSRRPTEVEYWSDDTVDLEKQKATEIDKQLKKEKVERLGSYQAKFGLVPIVIG